MAEVAKSNVSDILLSREYPQSPNSISPTPSRRESLRPVRSGNGSEPPTPTSLQPHLTRKRASSLDTDAANKSCFENLALTSASTINSTSGEAKICLCQPDPKIPRPRNAFILYRQHYQAQVVAHNPGLANPEISKIIGEQWGLEPVQVKKDWKRLAEEEKQRHHRQYPGYRYQPRRAGAQSRERRESSGEGPSRCPKCGGRYILASSTPHTVFSPSLKSQYHRLLPPFTPYRSPDSPSQNMTPDDRAKFPRSAVSVQRTMAPHQQPQRRPVFLQQNPCGLQLSSSSERYRENDMEVTSSSPDFKRRRFNDGSQGLSSPSPYDSPQYRSGPPLIPVTGYADGRRAQSQGSGPFVQHQKTAMMEPPRPSPASHQFSVMSLNSPYDESLRLPPLQTQVNHFGSAVGRLNGHQRTDSQARSVEAMVMTIPYINKIKVLSKISPPLAPPGPTSPVPEVRGAVIAIEGAESKIVTEVGSFIQEYLSREPECLVKTWPTPPEESTEQDSTMTGTDITPLTSPVSSNSFLSYLHTIQSWHERGVEITKFITTLPSPLIASAPSPTVKTAEPSSHPPDPTPTTKTSKSAAATSPTSAANPPNTPAPISTPRTPIALLPNGFSLTLSDHFASIIPITDSYAPVDHWQWMATLWRGIVGPDITIYVKALPTWSSYAPGLPPPDVREAMEEMARFGGVECRRDCGAVVVRVPVPVRPVAGKDASAAAKDGRAERDEKGGANGRKSGHGNDDADGNRKNENGAGTVEEKTLRRLGFEVLEMVRGGMAGKTDFGRG